MSGQFTPWQARPGRTAGWHDEKTFLQMASVDGNTLKAPPGQHDDRAMACVLALAALKWCSVIYHPSVIIPPADWLREADESPW